MTCQTCGRPAESGTPTHWLGCDKTLVVFTEPQLITSGGIDPIYQCEYEGCRQPKKEWSGKGAKPKYCAAGHKIGSKT